MFIVALIFLASAVYSLVILCRHPAECNPKTVLFTVVDFVFCLATVGLSYFNLVDTWVEYVFMALCLAYLIFRAKYVRRIVKGKPEETPDKRHK